LSTTQVLMVWSDLCDCPESLSNGSATDESVAVESLSVNAHCRVDLSASGGGSHKSGGIKVAPAVATVLALILVVVLVALGGERGLASGDLDLFRICS
jgi:hypothetical protein